MKILQILLLIIPLVTFGQENSKAMLKKGMDTAKYIPKGIAVGDMAPVIDMFSIAGRRIQSEDILMEKELVVIFYRGEWCPVCNRYLHNLNDSLEFILDKKAQVLVVGPENFESAKKIGENTKANFILIPDTTFKILSDFDVLFNVTKKYQKKIKTFLGTDIAVHNNQDEARLPVPATYIIGNDGLIKWRHFNYNYSERASVKAILDQLE